MLRLPPEHSLTLLLLSLGHLELGARHGEFQMIILSLNLREVGGAPKLLNLKRLILSTSPDIIFFQETMVDSSKAKVFFLKCCPTWDCVAIDASSLFGGLTYGWNPLVDELQAFQTFVGIFLEGHLKEISRPVKLLNCYGPYKDMLSFWKPLEESGFLMHDGLILGGDLNFSTSSREIWGEHARLDPLSDYFSSLFSTTSLVDIFPGTISPTWRNGWLGSARISKRLDRFYINESLLEILPRCRSWVLNTFFSDHNPVCLQFDEQKEISCIPFKFNHSWL
jgi:hypothetical protein